MPCQLTQNHLKKFPSKTPCHSPPPKKYHMYIYIYYTWHIQNKARFVHLKQNLGMFFLNRTWAGTVRLCLLSYYLTMLIYEYEPLGTNLKFCTHKYTQKLKKNTPARCWSYINVAFWRDNCCSIPQVFFFTNSKSVCHAKCSAVYVHPL